MKTLNRILIGTVLLATLFSCQDVVTYNDGYDDGMNSFGAPDVQGIYSPDDTDLQVPLTKGGFGEMIVLVGENLSNVTNSCQIHIIQNICPLSVRTCRAKQIHYTDRLFPSQGHPV